MKKNVFLAVALLALMAVGAFAQQYAPESDFTVTKSGNEITITKYVGKGGAVNIPPTIQNTPVTNIGNMAFAQSAILTSVTIPDSVKKIDQSAFFNCTKLTNLIIGKGVQRIELSAFNGCSSLTSVTFQGGVNVGGFNGQAFGSADSLRGKFYDTNKLDGTPGVYTKSGNTWTLTPAATPATSQYTSESDFRVLQRRNEITITGYTGKATVVNIPPTIQNFPVTSINEQTFGNTDITSVTIPNSVKSIGTYAFYGCTELTSVTIGSDITALGAQVFKGCTKLTSVTFQGTIPSSEFYDDEQFPGDLRAKFYATNKTNGTPGTYTRPNGSSTTWTKK
jgi:hypothetical protein